MWKRILLLLVIFLPTSMVFGQSETVYEGEYEFKGKTGMATFEFREDIDGNIILDGFFRFDRKEIDSLDQTLLTKFQARGEYKDNLKHGNWFFDQERHKINLNDVVNFEIQASLESEEVEIKASYKDGLPDGGWDYVENVFTQNKVQPKARAEKIRFSNGHMIDNLNYRNFAGIYTEFIRGRINKNGFMHGEWSLVYLKDTVLISEVRNYEEGLLLGITRRNLETGEKIDEAIYYSTIDKLNKINDGKNEGFELAKGRFGVDFNDGFRKQALQRQIQMDGNGFVEDFVKKLMRFDDSITDEEEILTYPFFTKRFEFQFTKEQQERLETIPVLFDQIKDSVDRYSEMNSLALNRNRSDSLAFSHAYFNNRVRKLEQMSELVDLIKTGDIKYYDLDNYTKDGIEFMSQTDLITYVYNEDTLERKLPRAIGYEGKETFLGDFEAYLIEEQGFISGLGDFVNRELYEIEVNSRLTALEAEILTRKNEVDSMYMSHKAISDDEQQLFLAIYRNFLEDGFDQFSKEYASENTFEGKIEKGELLLDLLAELEKRFPALTALYPRNLEIDELYMEETFNPFTYSRYDVRAKERLFESGAVQLFNHYVEELKEEDDYTQIKDHISKIEKLQERMIELRDQDTRSLERRLGRRNAPSRIESALDL